MSTPAGYSACRYGAEHDALQPPGAHESHNDSAYFNLTPLGEAGIAGAVVRIGMRPNEGYSEASVVMPRGDGTVVFQYARSPLEAGELPGGVAALGVGAAHPRGHRADAPLAARLHGRVPHASYGIRGPSPSAPARSGGRARRSSASSSSTGRPSSRCTSLSPEGNLMPGAEDVAYGKNHYEQFGRIDGTLRLGDEEWRIAGAPSFRDHSWGPRVWESAPDQDFVTVYLDDGRSVAAVANRAAGREDAHGVIWRPGRGGPGPARALRDPHGLRGRPVARATRSAGPSRAAGRRSRWRER